MIILPHHRRSIRLRGYDYTHAGAYFVTICVQGRECLFGDVVNGELRLNDAGRIAEQCWNAIPSHFPHVELDASVVMPNHIHGILVITSAGANNYSPLRRRCPLGTSRTIGSVVRGFKIGVTKWMRANGHIRDAWQRNYYEHIVRNESEMERIRIYIADNPAAWDRDRDQPDEPWHESNTGE